MTEENIIPALVAFIMKINPGKDVNAASGINDASGSKQGDHVLVAYIMKNNPGIISAPTAAATVFARARISRTTGARGIHGGTMGFGKMEAVATDKNFAFEPQQDAADGPYYRQACKGTKQAMPVTSGVSLSLDASIDWKKKAAGAALADAAAGREKGTMTRRALDQSNRCVDLFWIEGDPIKNGEQALVAYATKVSRTAGARGIHGGIMGFGKMEGNDSDKHFAFEPQLDAADGLCCRQACEGIKQATLIILGESLAPVASIDWKRKAAGAALAGAAAGREESTMMRCALVQSGRSANSYGTEEDPIQQGNHVLIAYTMMHNPGTAVMKERLIEKSNHVMVAYSMVRARVGRAALLAQAGRRRISSSRGKTSSLCTSSWAPSECHHASCRPARSRRRPSNQPAP